MAIALIGSAFISQDRTNGAATTAIDTSGANLIVNGVSWFDTTQPTLSDSKSNTFTFARSDSFFGTANIDSYWVLAPTVGSGHTFTPTGNNAAISAAAFSGVKTSSPFVTAVGRNQNSVSTITAGTTITPAVGDLIVALVYFESGSVSSLASPFTLLSSAVGGSGTGIGYYIATSTTAVDPTWTFSGSQARADCQLLQFLPAAGGGGATTWGPWTVSSQWNRLVVP